MSDNGKPEEKQKFDFSIEYDAEHPVVSERMRVKFNLNSFASNPHGTALLRGILEELKAEILRVIIAKRQAADQARAKILVPSGTKVPIGVLQ